MTHQRLFVTMLLLTSTAVSAVEAVPVLQRRSGEPRFIDDSEKVFEEAEQRGVAMVYAVQASTKAACRIAPLLAWHAWWKQEYIERCRQLTESHQRDFVQPDMRRRCYLMGQLIGRGADVWARDVGGRTPREIARDCGNKLAEEYCAIWESKKEPFHLIEQEPQSAAAVYQCPLTGWLANWMQPEKPQKSKALPALLAHVTRYTRTSVNDIQKKKARAARVEILLHEEVDPNVRDERKRTALHYLASMPRMVYRYPEPEWLQHFIEAKLAEHPERTLARELKKYTQDSCQKTNGTLRTGKNRR